MLKITVVAGMAALGLTACGAGPVEEEPTAKVDYSKLQYTPQSDTALVLADSSTLDSHVKNGIRLQLQQHSTQNPNVQNSGGAPTSTTTAPPEAADKNTAFSQTNVHVAGVDEADLVKYDGAHWYMAGERAGFPFLRVAAAGPDISVAAIKGEYALDENIGNIEGLYQIPLGAPASDTGVNPSKEVAVMTSRWGNVYGFIGIGFPIALPAVGGSLVADALPYYRPAPVNASFTLQWIDVQDPKKLKPTATLKIDGSLVDSRKVGNVVYIVTRFDPWLSTLKTTYGADEATLAANEKLLADAPIEQLLPQYAFNDEVKKPLTTKCLVPASVTKTNGLASVVNITAVDLTTKKVLGSNCINANLSELQVTPNNAYLTANYRDENVTSTLIHQFSLTSTGTAYVATGKVPGFFDGGNIGFRVSESGDYLRVLTTSYDAQFQPVHKLSVLKRSGNELAEVASLPSASQPAPIGKPGERIYGARFIGDRAYVVTFRQTDPLYVLDLADNTKPSIAGELEIPGFATYIHPVGESHLFTLGNSANAEGRVTGVKAELLDVTKLSEPKVVNTLQLGSVGTSSEGLYDLHALSFLQATNDQLRISFPLQVYGDDYQWQNTGLQLLEVNGLASAKPQLRKQGNIITETRSDTKTYPSKFGQIRSLLHENAVYVAQNASVWAALWQFPGMVKGPLVGADVICPAVVVPSAILTLKAADADPCKANVTAYSHDRATQLKGQPSADKKSCVFTDFGKGGNSWLVASLAGYNTARAVVRGADCPSSIPVSLELTPMTAYPPYPYPYPVPITH